MNFTPFFFASGGASTPVSIAPLTIDGRHFRTNGVVWKGCGVTAFRAYQLFITNGQSQLADYVDWWISAGGNLFRVLFTHGAPSDNMFLPWNYATYYPRLPEFFAWMAGRGARVLATCLTGQVEGWPEYMTPDHREMHVRYIAQAVGQTHLLEGINENFKNGRIAIPADWFEDGLWNLSCFNWDDAPPTGRWAAIHPERKEPEQCVRKGHDIIEIPFNGPRGITEWGQTPRDITTVDRNRAAGSLTSLYGSFTIAHGSWNDVQQCRIPTGDTRKMLEAHAAGFNSTVIPKESPAGHYARDEAAPMVFTLGGPAVPENPGYGCQHLYASDSTLVVVEPTPDFRHEPKPGWKITNDDGVAVHLEHV